MYLTVYSVRKGLKLKSITLVTIVHQWGTVESPGGSISTVLSIFPILKTRHTYDCICYALPGDIIVSHSCLSQVAMPLKFPQYLPASEI